MGSAPKEARRRAGLSSPRQRSESVDGISAPLDPLVRGFDPEQALRTSEERYQLLFKKNLAGVFLTKLDGEILDCNQSFARMLGYRSSEEVTPLRAQDLYFHDNDRSEFIQRLIEIRSLTNLEVRLKRRDGSELWTLENVALIGEGENALIQGTTVDITARKQAERALTESESKFRAVADMASSAIYIHDYQHFIYVNRASQEITGYSEEELLRMDPFALVHPDFCDLVRQRAVERLSGAQSIDRYEFQIVTKRGERRWVDFSAGTISFGG